MTDDVRKAKRALRRRVLALRDALGPGERRRRSLAVWRTLDSVEEYRPARTVLFFVSFRSEVLTGPGMRRALATGRRVVVPVTDREQRRLLLSEVRDLDADLRPGAYGIPEPPPGRRRPVEPAALDAVLLPGSVFDARGNRIGYGGGYYDAFCRSLRTGVPRIALAFDLQIVDAVPVEDHDLPVDRVVTETRVLPETSPRGAPS